MAYENSTHLKNVLGISGSTWDAFITAGITYCAVLFDQWSFRDFSGVTSGFGAYTRTMNQTLFMNGHDRFIVRSWPVQSFVAVTHGDTALVENTDFIYDYYEDFGLVRFIDAAGMPLHRWGRLDVTWTTGWDESDLPETIRGFVRRGVSYLFQRRMQEGVGADLMGDTQVTFRPPAQGSIEQDELKMIFRQSCSSLRLDVMGGD